MMLHGLYGITDVRQSPYERVEMMVEEALRGGMRILQLRDKETPFEELIPLAKRLQKLCHQYDAIFIIDDNIELVKKVDADGLHIGKDDMPLLEARLALPHKIIGVSCYGEIDLAKKAQKNGASYVAFGSFSHSKTKPASNIVSKSILKEAKESLSIPVCAIGGISSENAGVLIDQGADMISVINDLWNHDDIVGQAKKFSGFFE